MEDLYQMMFKRKSFRQFKTNEALTEDDLNLLRDFIEKHAVPSLGCLEEPLNL